MKVRKDSGKPMAGRLKRKEMIAGYLFLAPAAICLLVWTIFPIINSFRYSFTDFNVLSKASPTGLANYQKLFQDADWLRALKRTFSYVLLYVPGMYVIALLSAILVKHLKKGKGFFRTSFFLPVIVSAVAAGSIFKLILNTKMGLVNKIFAVLGMKQINFLGDEKYALISCAVLAIWMGFGYNMIIFLAGLQDIPAEYYEAAQIDGANGMQQFRYITFPGLGRTSVFVLTMSFIGAFQAYDAIYMLTSGGPNYSTTLAIQRIYMTAFHHLEMGYACAMTVMLFVIIFAVSMLQLKITSRLTDNGWE